MTSVLNGPRQPYPLLCVHELFERVSQRTPAGVALELLGSPPKKVSYSALLSAGTVVADRLQGEGVQRGRRL